jgi:hypothetical protein
VAQPRGLSGLVLVHTTGVLVGVAVPATVGVCVTVGLLVGVDVRHAEA